MNCEKCALELTPELCPAGCTGLREKTRSGANLELEGSVFVPSTERQSALPVFDLVLPLPFPS
jgi:hypothetical protein